MIVLAPSKSRPYPQPIDRWSLMTAPWHFQGLRVPIDNLFGWFEPALAWIDKSKRQQVYAVKDAAGDQLYGLSLSGAYREAGQPYEQYPGVDFTKDLAGLNALIDEIITGAQPGKPRTVRLFCAGDGQGSGPGYNNTEGLSYGCDWLMNYAPTLVKSLGFRMAYLQIYFGYDDIFYGWSPEQVAQCGAIFRALCPSVVLGIEHDIGHIPLGEGGGDYGPGGLMTDFDIVSSEYNSDPYLVHDNNVWQINGRLRYPAQPYNRPSDQPAGDDPDPPAYLEDSPRGPRVHEMMEWSTYWDVRGQCTPEGIDQDRAYLKAMSPDSLIA